MSEAKYLRITMHDNDYTRHIEYVGELLKEIFEYECFWFKYGLCDIREDDFPILKEMIKHVLYAVNNIIYKVSCTKRNFEYREAPLNNFECDLEFVDYLDIPEWDNNQSVYVPLFDGEILVR